MIIADTSGLLALYNTAEPQHEAVARFVASTDEPISVSPYVIAELDYLVATQIGIDAEIAVLRELHSGAYDLDAIDATDLSRARHIVERYRDQNIGIADASLVVLADRHRTKRILTLDHRHFTTLRPSGGGRFTLIL
jgi:uncharacterized protein